MPGTGLRRLRRRCLELTGTVAAVDPPSRHLGYPLCSERYGGGDLAAHAPATLTLVRLAWCRWTGRTGLEFYPFVPYWRIHNARNFTSGKTHDLTFEFWPGNRVHSAPCTFETTIPRCKCLPVTERSPNIASTSTPQAPLSAGRNFCDETSRAPIARTAAVGEPRRVNCLQMNPLRERTAEPMAIP